MARFTVPTRLTYTTVCLTLGISLLPSIANAQTSTDKHYQAICDANGMSFLSTGASPQAAQEIFDAQDEDFRSRCLILSDGISTQFQCACEEGGKRVEGTLPQPDKDSKPGAPDNVDPVTLLPQTCSDLYASTCGPFPDAIAHTCVSAYGNCDFEASGNKKDGDYDWLSVLCECRDQSAYVYEMQLHSSIELDEDTVTTQCERELSFCDPKQEDGPAPSSWIPDEEIKALLLGCASKIGEDNPQFACEVGADGKTSRTECQCGEELIEKSRPDTEPPSYATLRAHCQQELKRCDELGKKSPEPKDKPNIDEILDSIGCATAPSSPGTPLLGLLFLGPLALLRRSRSRNRNGAAL